MQENEVKNLMWGGVEWYKENIIEMITNIENSDYLEFIFNMMIAFKEKWGI